MTKIVCTIGPKTESFEMLQKLAEAGMNVARLNFSHGNYAEHGERIKRIKELNKKLLHPIAILLDTQGPEIRTGILKEDIKLTAGDKFTFTVADKCEGKMGTTITYKQLVKDVKKGDIIFVDDGMLEFEVQSVVGDEVRCKVLNSGILSSRKGVNIPGIDIKLPALSEKDVEDIKFGIKNDVDYIAVSFVRRPEDVTNLRKFVREQGADTLILAKIEHMDAVNNFDAILDVSDGIMIARGDLGVQVPYEEIPTIQRNLIMKCNKAGKPVITATHMLNSMTEYPRPTRAEVSDVANSVLNGTDAVMLSAESAKGKYPIESAAAMDKICRAIEKTMESNIGKLNEGKGVPEIIARAVAQSAEVVGAKAITTFTITGNTAQNISKFRTKVPIFAMTTSDKIIRATSLFWGVYSFKMREYSSTDEMIKDGILSLKKKSLIAKDDLVVITCGVPLGKAGMTNLAEIRSVE
ncbi:Pyruvate kinase [uncultured archaeon]|nr:Pyruvate kinase [uncultured archaeon]